MNEIVELLIFEEVVRNEFELKSREDKIVVFFFTQVYYNLRCFYYIYCVFVFCFIDEVRDERSGLQLSRDYSYLIKNQFLF